MLNGWLILLKPRMAIVFLSTKGNTAPIQKEIDTFLSAFAKEKEL